MARRKDHGLPVPDIPRGTVAGIFRHLAQHEPELYVDAIRRGIKTGGAKSYPFVALGAAYLDGRPIERIQLQADARMLFVPASGALAAVVPDMGDDE